MNFIREIKKNPGLLPKVLITIFRFGNFVYFRIKIPVFRQLLIIIYRLIDLIFVKLLFNCDILGKTKIGHSFVVYHPYGILINSGAVIGNNCVIRAQVTIGNKGEGYETCPVIGNNVEIGVGAKIIGGIKIGDNCKIGTNAVVTKSFPANSILVGVPAKNIAKK